MSPRTARSRGCALGLGIALALGLGVALAPAPARAGYTEVVPKGVFLLDARYVWSTTSTQWTDEGKPGPLLEPIKRYEPGGGWQGTLIPDATARYSVIANLLVYGITDHLSAVLAVPLILQTSIDPSLGWVEGDYSIQIGRSYSEEDFWAWAGSMKQPKPSAWKGNKNTLSDIVLATRFRFDEHFPALRRLGLRTAITAFGALPTGRPPDPEELVAAGTTSWNLNTQGELGLHLSVEKELGARVLLGLDLFHEIFLPHRFASSTGATNPLLLNTRPYVGESYRIDGGDFTGFELGVEAILFEGPILKTWLARRMAKTGGVFPSVLTLELRYGFTYVGQSDWSSDSPLWDWEQERFWKPGYKNILKAEVTVSLLRFGVPLILYGQWRDLTLLPGKNVRGPMALSFGVQLPLRFW